MQCITIDWLKESYTKKRILPIDKYKVPYVFYGVRIGVYGYSEADAVKIVALLKNNGAELAINITTNGANALNKMRGYKKPQ